MKYYLIIISIMLIMLSCSMKEKHLLKDLKSKDLSLFMGLSIEARKKNDNKFIAYKFNREFKDQRFSLPNFNYYSESQIKDPELFDVMEYAEANGLSNERDALSFVKGYSDSVMSEYERLRIYKIFSSYKQGEFIVFFLDKDDFLAFVPDKNKIYSDFWKKKLNLSKEIEPNWIKGKY